MKTPPQLSPEIESLLAPHRRILPLAPSVEARALARAAAAVDPWDPVIVRAPRTWLAFAVAAGLVIVAGAGAYAARAWRVSPSPVSPRPARIATPVSTAPHTRPSPVVAAAADDAEPLAPVVSQARRSTGRSIAPTVRPTNAELQLLRAAREALTRGDFGAALVAVGEHARRFRNGTLAEEREALRVKSLAGLGRHDDAQRAAARFHVMFPHSVLLSTFERMAEPVR
jgi:hypothetical protein